jgi:hypothetical protein
MVARARSGAPGGLPPGILRRTLKYVALRRGGDGRRGWWTPRQCLGAPSSDGRNGRTTHAKDEFRPPLKRAAFLERNPGGRNRKGPTAGTDARASRWPIIVALAPSPGTADVQQSPADQIDEWPRPDPPLPFWPCKTSTDSVSSRHKPAGNGPHYEYVPPTDPRPAP